MGFSLKKLLEGAAAQINMNDSGKTFATVVRNQPVQSQPAKTPPPSYGSNPVKQAINRTRDVFDANTPQDRFKRQLAQKPVIDFTAQDRARQTVNGVKNVAGNYAKGFVESYNQVGTGLGTLLAQNSADVKNAQKAQNNLADQLHQQRMTAIKTAKNPNLNDVQRNRLNNYYNSLDRADVDLQNSRTQQSNDLYNKLDPKKNLAAIGSVGFDIATLGVGTGGTQAVKQAFKSGIKTGAKELGGQMVKTGSLGAVSGGLSPIVQKGDQATAKDILQGAGMGFATGAALPAVAPAVKFGGSKAVNTIKGLTKENLGAISPKFGQSVAMATPDGQVIRGLDRFKTNQAGFARSTEESPVLKKLGIVKDGEAMSVEPLEALKAEARKYKSAEEFVNSFNLMKSGEVTSIGQLPIGKVNKTQIKAITERGLPHTDTNLKAKDFTPGRKITQPLEVYSKGGSYVVENGNHRLAQAIANGDTHIPVVFKRGEGKSYTTYTKSQLIDLYNQAHTPPVEKTVEQTPFGPVKAKTPAVNQTLEQPAISTNKTIQSQQRTKPLGVNENTGNDLNTSQKQLLKQKSQELVKSSYSDNTPNPVVKEYAKMLKEYDDSALGGELIPDGKNGYTRSTNHSPFYSGYFKMYGRKPSVKAWEEEALSQLQKGKADSEFQKAFNDFNNPEIQSLYNSNPGKALSPLDQNKLNAKQLRQEVIDFRKGLVPVKQTNKESKIPVLKVAKDGDVVTKTNVNPNIKKGEKRFSIGKDGELQEDTKGAYRLFTDDDGKVTSFRIGNKVYDAKDFGDLSQVNNYGSTIATMRRNIERAYKNNPTASDKIQRFIVDHQQHQATKMIERQVAFRDSMKKIADDLGISFSGNKGKAKKVSADIQNFGEGVLSKDDLVKKYGSEYAEKMVNADTWFRNQYDAVLNEMNSTLTKYGYDPIPRRSNYYTHFQDENVWKKFGIKMDEVRNLMNGQLQEANPTGVRGAIPSKLAGESEYLLPNKKFNPYALKREGGAFTPDAFQAFEKYLNPALNNIYMTPSITRTRVLAKAIAQNSDLAGTSPSKLIVQMREWANHLAGKTNRLGDRQAADSDWASTALKASEYVQRKVGQQSIVGNAATAVMQPVVLAQTSAKAGYKNTMLGIMQEFSSAHSKNAPIRQSEFMRRRYLDTTPVTAGKLDKASNVASTPLKVIEESAGRITWNSYYNQALEKGFKGKEAIRFADVNAEKTMAGRAIGEKPELYRSKTAGMATQFQLEVNNMWQQLGKEFSKKDIARFVVASYALNMGMQQIIGRQPSFNPLDAVIDSAEIAFDDEKSPQEKAKQIAQRVGGEVVGSAPILPQVIGLFMDDKQVKKFFGTQTPVGRFGVGSTFRSFGDNTIGKVMQGKPLEAGAYLATPFGYNQAQKTVKGIQAVNQGELKDENGQTTVQIPKTPLNYAKGALFGPSAIPEVNAYYSNIGVDKKDQKTVPNQTNSVASRQGNAPILTREDQLKDAKNSIKYGAGKEWQNLSEEDIKNKAIAGDQTAAGIYKSLQTMEKVYGAKNIPTPGLSAAAEDVLNQAKKITKEGQSAWGSRPTENKNAQKAISQLAGEELQVDNATAEKWAKYERDRVTGKINELDKVKAQRDILKSAYSSTLSADEKKYFSYNDTDLINALQNGSLKPDSLAKAMSVDAQLVSKGLITTSGFGKKVWNALGLAYPSVKGSSTRTSGRRTSGRRVSSKKLKTTKTISLDTFKKYKSKRSSTNSALRKLLGSAKV